MPKKNIEVFFWGGRHDVVPLYKGGIGLALGASKSFLCICHDNRVPNHRCKTVQTATVVLPSNPFHVEAVITL